MAILLNNVIKTSTALSFPFLRMTIFPMRKDQNWLPIFVRIFGRVTLTGRDQSGSLKIGSCVEL